MWFECKAFDGLFVVQHPKSCTCSHFKCYPDVRRDSVPLWVVLQCPCRCGERLNVNLMRTARPHWTLSLTRGKASLSPSLWVSTNKCGSHFWLVDNGVIWAPRRSIE